VTAPPKPSTGTRKWWVDFRTIADRMNSERLRDLVYYVTGGRFKYLGENVLWWVVIPQSKEREALDALKEHAAGSPRAYRKIANETSLAAALTALGFDPYVWDEYMDPADSPVLWQLAESEDPELPEMGGIVVKYLGRQLVVAPPELGSIVLGRGSWSQRSLKHMPETDELVLHALAKFVHLGSVAHSNDGRIRYMYEKDLLVRATLGGPGRSFS
jgi:hypothetical protein